MIFSIVRILAITVLCNVPHAYKGISTYTYSSVQSHLILSSDNMDIYPYEKRYVGSMNVRNMTNTRLTLVSNSELNEIKKIKEAGRNYSPVRTSGRGITPVEYFKEAPVNLGGFHLFILHPHNYSSPDMPGGRKMFADGIISTWEDENSWIQFSYYDIAQEYLDKVNAGASFEYGGYLYIPNASSIKMRCQGGGAVNGKTYLEEYKRRLLECGLPVRKMVLARKISSGRILPIGLFEYGEKSLVYAMYGEWESNAEASKYGYKAGDRIFFSEKEILPSEKYPDFMKVAAHDAVDRSMRFGAKVFTYNQVMRDKKGIFPLLSWRGKPFWSGMKRTFDSKGSLVKVGNEYPPTKPDDYGNTNEITFKECPDKDFYYALYIKCLDRLLSTHKAKSHPKDFQNIRDYFSHSQMISDDIYDNTIYDKDGAQSPKYIATSNPPAEPMLFNKDGKLLNRDFDEYYDPWDSGTKFMLAYRRVKKYTLGLKHEHKNHDLTHAVKPVINSCLELFSKDIINKAHQYVTVKWSDSSFKDSAVYLGNPLTHWNEYESPADMCTFDENYVNNGGRPFKTVSHRSSGSSHSVVDVFNQEDTKDWFIEWKWKLVYKNRWDTKYGVGEAVYKRKFYHEENKLMASGQKAGGKAQNKFLRLTGEKKDVGDFNNYDKKSKEYRTDQADPHDRNKSIDKGDAILEIARKILIAEGLNFAVKFIYQQTKGSSKAAAYEAIKRLENTYAVKKTQEVAEQAYELYVLWATTMDVIAEVRDTYNSIGPAWDGLLHSITGAYEYYKTLDYSSIRLTNLTDLMPATLVFDLDYSFMSFQHIISDFSLAVDGMAFQSDLITKGNYGPAIPLLNSAYDELSKAVTKAGYVPGEILNKSVRNLERAKKTSDGTSSEAAYLSNFTSATHNIITNELLRVQNESVRSLAMALFITESESRDWLITRDYLKNTVSGTPEAFKEAKRKGNFFPIINRYNTPGVFTNSFGDDDEK